MTSDSQFDRMYDSFRIFGVQDKVWARDFIPLSAGVNWLRPNPAVIDLLSHELSQSVTVRNYGGVGGLPPITRLLEFVEGHVLSQHDLKVTITHGTTEGANLAMHVFAATRPTSAEQNALMIGHGFPLYRRLSEDFGLNFHECLGQPTSGAGFMPTPDEIASVLSKLRPSQIFLILPNNPLGEIINAAAFKIISDYIVEHNAHLLVDRVCLLPWDKRPDVLPLIGPLVTQGRAVVVDSFSKSESLAGFRAGYLVSNETIKAAVIEIIRSRFLNPVVFPTATLAVTRLAEAAIRGGSRVAAIYKQAHDTVFSEYPRDEYFQGFFEKGRALLTEYQTGLTHRQNTIVTNYKTLCDIMSDQVCRPLILDGGFNVALSTKKMSAATEEFDQLRLAQEYGVGVLTSRCFCTRNNAETYFIRMGLAVPEEDFAEGIRRLDTYYKNPKRLAA